MTALNLLDAIVARLHSIFSDYALPTKSGSEKKIKVFAQFLPRPKGPTVKPRGADEEPQDDQYGPDDFEENFPCVIVKFDEGVDKEENAPDATRISVRILIGAYDPSPDEQGYRDVMNIMEKVRLELLSDRLLNRRYRLEMPFKWYLFEDQPWPIFFGQIETAWETGRPAMPGTGNIYGKF